MGIINGTTNYMLTKMSEEGLSYAQALAEAQAKGYAESDPTADVEGIDAARKIAVLASLAFNTALTLKDVHVEGIDNIEACDIDDFFNFIFLFRRHACPITAPRMTYGKSS